MCEGAGVEVAYGLIRQQIIAERKFRLGGIRMMRFIRKGMTRDMG